MKKLIPFLFVLFFSCNKYQPKTETIEYIPTIVEEVPVPNYYFTIFTFDKPILEVIPSSYNYVYKPTRYNVTYESFMVDTQIMTNDGEISEDKRYMILDEHERKVKEEHFRTYSDQFIANTRLTDESAIFNIERDGYSKITSRRLYVYTSYKRASLRRQEILDNKKTYDPNSPIE